MDKKNLLDQLLIDLQKNLEALIHTAWVAREAATGEESKAENKYDTRGLEASYLAGAQAQRAEELRATLYKLQKTPLKAFVKSEAVALTALVQVMMDDDHERLFFLLPAGGGQKMTGHTLPIHVITPESPVGQQLLGKHIGDQVIYTLSGKSVTLEILDLF